MMSHSIVTQNLPGIQVPEFKAPSNAPSTSAANFLFAHNLGLSSRVSQKPAVAGAGPFAP